MKHPIGWRVFAPHELQQYDGSNRSRTYVACNGIVYDVTDSFLWQKGRHQALHEAGADLTGSLQQAPHDTSVFDRSAQVGVLAAEDDAQ